MKRDYELYLVYFLLVIGVIVLFYTGFGFFNNDFTKNVDEDLSYNTNLNPITSGGTDSGDVSIELIPRGMSNGNFVITANFNTHSVDLNQFNLREITSLGYNRKIIKPVSVPILSGHHSSGNFVFNVNKDDIKEFKVVIKGIPKIKERVFNWS